MDSYTGTGSAGNLELAREIVGFGKFDQVILETVLGGQLLPLWILESYRPYWDNRQEVESKRAAQSFWIKHDINVVVNSWK